MSKATGRHVQCQHCGLRYEVRIPEPKDKWLPPTACSCGQADWDDFASNTVPVGELTSIEPIRIPPLVSDDPADWHSPLTIRIEGGRIRDSVADRSQAAVFRKLEWTEEEVVEILGYSPRPLQDGE